MRIAPFTLVPVVALLLAGCITNNEPAVTPAHVDVGFGHVHGVDVNPADGVVHAATHTGLFRLGPSGPVRVADRYQDTMGFTIVGPDTFLGSGHPGPGGPGPGDLGLIRSTDGARTWQPVALSGAADFHVLSAAGAILYGWDAISGRVLRSDDTGENWQIGARADVSDLDVDPENPLRVVVATVDGLRYSVDGGAVLTPTAVQPPRPIVLLDHDDRVIGDRTPRLVGLDGDGGVWALHNEVWVAAGNLPGPPQAFTVIGPDRYLAATSDGVYGTEDAGRSWQQLAPSSG